MRNTRQFAGRVAAAAGLSLAALVGPLVQSASAQNIGGQIIKVFGGSDSRQGEKNAMRNLGVGLGAVAAYEAINHRNGSALLLGAGAALAGKRYEDVRKTQSKENNRYGYRDDWRRDRDNDRNNGRKDHDNDWRRDQNESHDRDGRRDADWRRDQDARWHKDNDRNHDRDERRDSRY